MEGFEKYQSKTVKVEAIQFTFDNLKLIYIGLGMRNVTYYIKDRIIAGILTTPDGKEVPVAKEDYIVLFSGGNFEVMKPAAFSAKYEPCSAVEAAKQKMLDDQKTQLTAEFDKQIALKDSAIEELQKQLTNKDRALSEALARAEAAEAELEKLKNGENAEDIQED
ncbi:MAG: hypothetical protein II547_09400 [Treponema sp.]|nr:hypothetical protein [Treponema sp.]